jgi:solute carrier family 35 (UDP-sugar transporter), member A1/2/3
MNEILKLLICVAVVMRDKARENKPWSLKDLWAEIFGGDAWKLTIPAALYTVPLFLMISNVYSSKTIYSILQFQILTQLHSKLHINLKS